MVPAARRAVVVEGVVVLEVGLGPAHDPVVDRGLGQLVHLDAAGHVAQERAAAEC
jgi:hypothetical protein